MGWQRGFESALPALLKKRLAVVPAIPQPRTLNLSLM
jgi:hypothetical protein